VVEGLFDIRREGGGGVSREIWGGEMKNGEGQREGRTYAVALGTEVGDEPDNRSGRRNVDDGGGNNCGKGREKVSTSIGMEGGVEKHTLKHVLRVEFGFRLLLGIELRRRRVVSRGNTREQGEKKDEPLS
jgi:hypothetical protein